MRHAGGVGVPAAALLVLQLIVFVATADRGLDFTDESFYLLSYQHGRDLAASTTLFGVFLEAPFRLLGGDVAAMRVFGLALLLASGALLAARVFAFARPAEAPRVPWPFLVAGTAGALLYYVHLTTLRAPSYNLLVLACVQAATALVLMLADDRMPAARARVLALAYGAVLGVCGLTKAPSALALAACHLAFLLGVAPSRRLPGRAALALAGAALVALAMSAVHPHWIDAMRTGVATATALDTGFGALPWPSPRSAAALAAGALAFAGLAALVRRPGPPWLASTMVVAVMGAAMVPFVVAPAGKVWWPLMAAGTALAWTVAARHAAPPDRRLAGLVPLLLALPLCYSIGTNGALAAHSRMAGGTALLALLLALHRLHAHGLVGPGALAVALALPAVPVLVLQARAQAGEAGTYRLATGLAEQREPTVLGREGRSLRLDAGTRAGVQRLAAAMAAAGYRAGEPILDMTGDGPGLVYALGGRPLGAAWLLGGYPGSERAAAIALAAVPAADLRRAWVVSNDANPRALRGWPDLLRAASKGAVSIEPAGSVDGPGQPLTLWRPRQPQM